MTKTKVLIITNQSSVDKDSFEIKINEDRLQLVDEIRYLGIVIDDRLDFKINSDYVCKKLGKKVGVLSRLRNELNFGQKMLIYISRTVPQFCTRHKLVILIDSRSCRSSACVAY